MTGGLKLHTGNRMEILARRLAHILKTPLGSPLETETIVVQSVGMERWLRMQLSLYHGICANVAFPFPNAFVREISRRLLADLPEQDVFEPAAMTWRIFGLLPACTRTPGFEKIRSYMGDDGNDLKRYQLAAVIADLFDQYQVFRPEMIISWEKGSEDHWQARLWRKVVAGREGLHRAVLHRRLVEALQKREIRVGKPLPDRVSVFGISTLPPYHLDLLQALSLNTEVNLFLVNPCAEYWGEIFSEREKRAFLRRAGRDQGEEASLHLEEGNGLLASNGALGREFFTVLAEMECQEDRTFEDPEPVDMLHTVQSDILNLRDRELEGSEKILVSPNDESIQIHSCHSPMREMEVLHDRLLSMLEKDPSLEPRQILVMTPDIDAYAPLVQAVFGVPEKEDLRIPYSIADRNPRTQSRVIASYLGILDLPHGRFAAEEVLALLECPSIREKFQLAETDLLTIRRWVQESGIRWGKDAGHKGDMGLPPFPENTWRFGLERLLLGYAMPASDRKRMFKGILPYDRVEGEEAAILGRFAAFLDGLMCSSEQLEASRTLPDWTEFLANMLATFFSEEEPWEREAQAIRHALNDLVDQAETSGFSGTVEREAVREHVLRQLEQRGYGTGFITRGVTFCAMLPMRSIPFKVICLLGMNGDAYPRRTRKLGFDLMAAKPRRCDRSRRDDDRYLFLETLLSTRETLYISYEGQSVQDNSPIPPSVLVSELLDYLDKNFRSIGAPDGDIRSHVFVTHRLQPFNPAYFGMDEKLFSYSQENLTAALQKLSPPSPNPAFIPTGLSAPGEEWGSVDLTSFLAFFANPAKFIVRERLHIHLGQEEDKDIEEKEPFKVDGLDRYRMEQDLVNGSLTGKGTQDIYTVLKAEGRLPHGTAAGCIYERLREGAEIFSGKVGSLMQAGPAVALELRADLNGVLVQGTIEGIQPEALVQFRYAKAGSRDFLTAWINHLFLNHAGGDDLPRRTILLAKDGTWFYEPVESAWEILENLGKIFLSGLRKPLRFFPDTSLAYAKVSTDGRKSPEKAMEAARDRWSGNDYVRGEAEDPHYRLCFGNTNPLDEEFRDLSLGIYGPLLSTLRKSL